MRRYLNYIGGGETLIYFFLAIGIAFIVSMFIGAKIPKFRQDKKRYFIYTLLQGVSFVIFGTILYNLKDTSLHARFIAVQVYLLIAGSVHLIFFRMYFKKFETKAIYKELLIGLVTAIFVSAFVIIIVAYFKELDYLVYFLVAVLWFIFPTLCYNFFETAVSIPAKLHKRWFYPVNSKYPPPQISDMRNVIILNFIFQKKPNDKQIINFKVKAPRAFDFGKLFYYFINDYNEKNPNSHINYLDEKGEPYGWYFYTKPKWFGASEHIDPDVAIDTNNIKDGETIICQRI
jgi:hypothetical protein